MRLTSVFKTTTVAAALALTIAMGAAFAASGFVGKWQTTDTEGKPFTIWLSEDGLAKGDRGTEGLSGMWKEDGNAAVITWDTDWVTKITKEGESYMKSAEKDGKAVGGASEAKKVE